MHHVNCKTSTPVIHCWSDKRQRGMGSTIPCLHQFTVPSFLFWAWRWYESTNQFSQRQLKIKGIKITRPSFIHCTVNTNTPCFFSDKFQTWIHLSKSYNYRKNTVCFNSKEIRNITHNRNIYVYSFAKLW